MNKGTWMEIMLAPELEQRLQVKVARGEYPSAAAALNEAVRRLLEPEPELAEPFLWRRCAARS